MDDQSRAESRAYYTPGQSLFNSPEETSYPNRLMMEEDDIDLRSFHSPRGNFQQSDSYAQLLVMVQEQQGLLQKLMNV